MPDLSKTSAVIERSKCQIKHIKSLLLSTMDEARLSTLALFPIERELAIEAEVDYDKIIERFARMKLRRKKPSPF